ncbi:MAG: hypothetical protein LC637_09560 [Xanthomonadaceae bacterium]|nr:hypothetical protein [Xanthomonadaceae bacterium]
MKLNDMGFRGLGFGMLAMLLLSGDIQAGDVDAGERLYRYGIQASGQPVEALGFGDVPIKGNQAACIQCHRRSGYGSYEGGYYIPPITQPYLFAGRKITRDDRFRAQFYQAQDAMFLHQVRRFRNRPPYTVETLGTLMRTGVDPVERQVEELMPRYELSEHDLANLAAYLQTLSIEISPGVSDDYVEIATILHTDVPRGERDAIVGVMDSFVEWYNDRTLGDLALSGHSIYGSSLYTRYSRLYNLNVWEISGPSDTWADQLQAHYDRHPVFALVSGKVPGDWSEIGKFSDRLELPTLFPITDVPHELPDLGGYTVYFNRGVYLEAEIMLEWLNEQEGDRVVQLFEDTPESRKSAAHFEEVAQRRAADLSVASLQVEDLAAGKASLPEGVDHLIVWQNNPDASQLAQWQSRSGATHVLLPDDAVEVLAQAPDAEGIEGLLFSYPRVLDQEYYPERYRARGWLNSRGLDFEASRVQFSTLYAMMMFRDAFMHILDHYHRDFLLEILEHEIQGSPNPGLYPDMELGARQRFVSKSGYMVQLDKSVPGGVSVVGRRIAP